MHKIHKTLKRSILGLSLSLLSMSAFANINDNHYDFTAKVANHSKEEKVRVTNLGLSEVLTKITGETITVDELPQDNSSTIDEYSYNKEDNKLSLSLTFSNTNLQKLINRIDKKAWLNKPTLLIWPFYKNDNRLTLIDGNTNDYLLSPIINTLNNRLISFIYPEASLELLDKVNNRVLDFHFYQDIANLSQAYALPYQIMFIFEGLPDRKVQISALLFNHEKLVQELTEQGENSEQLLNSMLSNLILAVKKLSLNEKRFSQSFYIEVTNVSSPSRYNEILSTLKAIKLVDNIQLDNLSEDSVTYVINTTLSPDELIGKVNHNKTIHFKEKNKNTLVFAIEKS